MLAARWLAVVLTIGAAGCNLYFGAASGDHVLYTSNERVLIDRFRH